MDRNRPEPGIVGHQKRSTMLSHVSGTGPTQFIVEQPVSVDIRHHNSMAKFIGPIITLIDHRPCMRMSASELIVLPNSSARFGPVTPRKMLMIRARLHQAIKVGIEIFTEHSLVMRPWDQMPEMANDIVREE